MTLRNLLDRITRLLSRISPEGVLAAVLVILFFPILFGGRAIFWGLPMLQFYPWHWLARQDLFAGHLPLWNPMLGMGAPLLANAQSGLLYPPNWLLIILPVDLGQGWLMVAHLLLAGAGMVRLCRRLKLGPLAQTIGGLAFMLSGYLVARGWFLTINASVAWVPWIILAGEDAWQRRRWFSIPLGILLALQWLAGHWQTAWYTGLLLAGWLLARAVFARPVWRSILRWMALVAGAVGLAFALAAVQILPTVEYWLASQRAGGVGLATAGAYSFWPWDLIRLIAPGFFGSPVTGNYWGYANFWENALYIGALPLLLALAAVLQRLRRRAVDGFPYGFLILIIPLAFAVGMGTWSPVFPFLYDHVPTFNLFQAPTRIMILAVFALALLAAAGAEWWPQAPGKASRAPIVALVFSLAGIVAGTAALFLPVIRNSTFGSSILAAGIFCALASILWLWKSRSPAVSAAWRAALVLAVIADLWVTGSELIPSIGADLYRRENPVAQQAAVALAGRRIYMPEDVRYAQMFYHYFRFDSFQAAADWMDVRRLGLPNLTVLDGISSADNFDSFIPARTATLLETVDALPADQRDSLLRMMDVGAVWEGGTDSADPTLRLLPAGARRAWGVCRAQWALDGDTALQMIQNPAFDPLTAVVLETGGGEEGGSCPSEMAANIRPQDDPNALSVDTGFSGDGFLVLADTDYPGWEAFLDGERVPLLRANYAFRAVRVPAGAHTVDFRYAPYSFAAGLILSTVALALLGVVGLFRIIRSIRRRSHPQGELA